MRITFHHRKKWKRIVNISLVLLIILIFIQMFFSEAVSESAMHAMEIFDILFTMVLAVDLLLWYLEAKDKYNFIRRNWVKIIAVFPFMFIFRGIQILRLEQVFSFAFSGEIIADILAMEKLLRLEKGVKVISKAAELFQHW